MKNRIYLVMFLLSAVLPIWAQIGGDYNPDSPSDPGTPVLKHQLTIRAVPEDGGSFNLTDRRLAVGSSTSLSAYTSTDFVFKQWLIGDSVVSESQNMKFVMPDHDVELVGQFEYNPANPANPNSNYWNKETGEVIVDDFTTGSLSRAISTAISGSNSSAVRMITVAGKINSNDFGIVNSYKNCGLLDLSRVTGVSEVPSYAFDYTSLETVYLPATIEKIGSRAFEGCSQLSSLIVYAMTPPALGNYVFQSVPEGLIVYVPAAAIPLYKDEAGWSNFTILPIQEDIRSISVSLPKGVNAADYAQMWLELTNTKNGQRMHYVMTDRTSYTFNNIIRNTSWKVTLRNERGDVFGQIDGVEVKDDDVSVMFASLARPQNVTLNVLAPDGSDVTAQTQVTWTDVQGNYIAQSTTLAGLPAGYQAAYRIVLSQDLAMMYSTPLPAEYVLLDGNNDITCQLSAIPQVKIIGKVKDVSNGLPLDGTTVSASQTFGGKYGKTISTKTDRNGEFMLEVPNVPTSIAFAASDYISQTVRCDSLLTGNGTVTLADILLKAITGATITLDFTYTTCDGEKQNWYSDYNNVSYELYNETKQCAVSQYNVQYPQIVLLEEVDDNDVLRLTATSRTNVFMPVVTKVTVAEQKALAMFQIKELGKIQSSFATTDNAKVVGSLYDSNGKLVKTYDYSNTVLTIPDLADGQYTLITMGSSRLFNTIYDIAQLPQTGLVAGTDYVQNSVEVESGAVSVISIEEVPALDETKLYYTGDNTSFAVNKPSIVAGNYLTLTGHIDFKPAYAASVRNVQMIVDLPESCEFVENSVMVGNATSSYTVNGHQIAIPMERYTDRVRFCVVPTRSGEYTPSAFTQFDLNGKTVTQPIGSANYTVQDLFISVPSTVAKTSVPISGTAVGQSAVEIYDDGMLIGNTTSLANGTWKTTCELNEPYNLSTHNIYAKVTTKAGLELISETKQVMYDVNMIVPEKVTMLYYNPEYVGQYNIVFDLINRTVSPKSYYFFPYKSYPNWRGSGTEPKDFTFIADLSNNDSTAVNGVVIRVYTDNGYWRNLEAQYNTSMNRWVAVSQFIEEEAPVGVEVEIDACNDLIVDDRTLESYYDFAKDDILDYNNYVEECDSLINDINAKLSSGTSIDVEKIMNDYYSILGFVNNNANEINEHYKYLESLSEDALLDYIDGIIAELDSSYNGLMNNKDLFTMDELTDESIYGEINLGEEGFFDVKTEHVGNVTESELLSQGFAELKTVGGNKVYYFVEGSRVEMYDFANDMHISYSNTKIAAMVKLSSVGRRALDVNEWRTIITNATNIVRDIEEKYHKIKEIIDTRVRLNNEAIDILRKYTNKTCMEFEPLAKLYQKYGFPGIEDRLARLNQRVGVFQKGIKNLTANSKLLNGLKVVGKSLTKGLNIVAIIDDGYQTITDMNDWLSLGLKLRAKVEDCENYRTLYNQTQIQGYSILTGYISLLTLDLTSVASVLGALGTAGTSLILSVGSSVVSTVGGIYIPRNSANYKREIRAEIPNVPKCKDDKCPRCGKNPCECKDKCPRCGNKPCTCPDKCPRCGKTPCECPPPPNTTDVQHDPSGYVYEGVASNRLQGVMASCYYKETVEDMYGDQHENVVLWDAEEYAQENPLFTDEYGMYRWDVPKGLWQVKFEKEGYETTYSEWLPVPPPQLEVNIGMKQNRQPEVKNVRAYEDAVEVEFDKYMMPELLTTANVAVLQNGTPVEGAIELLNEERSMEGSDVSYASKIRFNSAKPFTEREVTLVVNNRVKSYAGIRMQDNYQQTFRIEQEIKNIVNDSLITINYGEAAAMVVSVLPASASSGKTLKIKTSSQMIVDLETEQVVIGKDGTAEILLTGELPGTAALTFSIEGTDKTATTIVNVERVSYTTVATPTASITSGSVVEKGTEITLSCKTESATIYYTLDGACPCDDTESRKVYDGTPIIVNKDITIKAMATAPGLDDSDIAEFKYRVSGSDGIEDVTLNGQIEIWPLPVRDELNVTAGGKVIKHVTVTTSNGVQVISENRASKRIVLDTRMLVTGLYIINIVTDGGECSRKIIKIE